MVCIRKIEHIAVRNFRFSGKYHPDIVFIDEASHASEPECNCAIALLTPGKPVVLAGDPKQLGPICFSTFAMGKLGMYLNYKHIF